MSLTDRHLDELKRDAWRKLPARIVHWRKLLNSDVRAVARVAARALANNDRRTVIAIGEAAMEQGLMAYRPLRRIGMPGGLLHMLLAEGRYERALEIMPQPLEGEEANWGPWLLRARALAGLDRLKEARAILISAQQFEPGPPRARALLALIDAERKLKTQLSSGQGDWSVLHRLVEVYLQLKLDRPAAKTIRSQVSALPAPAPADYEHALAVLKAALPLLGPEYVLRQAARMQPCATDDRLRALAAEALIAFGSSDEAVGPDEGGRDMRFQRALACAATGDLDEAIARLGLMTQELQHDLEIRSALAHFVGIHVLDEAPLELREPGGKRRIFNLVPFNDEILLLKAHLTEMAGWVDTFVIVESEVTFTGAPKPLHFQDHRQEFAQWADKIRHVVVPEHPPAFRSPWGRDFRQRDMAIAALSGLAAPGDLVLLTDVDEIFDRRALEGFDAELAGLRMSMYRFFLNYRPAPGNRPVRRTGAVCTARLLGKFGSSYTRFFLARDKDGPVIDDAGWHFTSICDADRLVAKINSYAHQEHNDGWSDLSEVDRRLARIRSGVLEKGWERAEIDETFPVYLREHREDLSDFLI